MCKYCFEHTRKAWYLQKESYDIRSGRFLKILPGRFRELWYDFYSPKLQGFVDGATTDIAESGGVNRKPFTGLKKAFYNYFTRNFLGGQVVTSLDEMMQVLDNAQDVYLSYCSCKKSAGGGEDLRCIFLNHNATFNRKKHMKDKGQGRYIDLDEAREMIIEKRKLGHYGTVLWGLRPKVDCICNCDQYCAGLYTPEIRWGLLPSFSISQVVNFGDICLQTCYAKAIDKKPGNQITSIEQEKCIGCNLCVERCPNGVFESTPRKIYYDAAIGKKVEMKEV